MGDHVELALRKAENMMKVDRNESVRCEHGRRFGDEPVEIVDMRQRMPDENEVDLVTQFLYGPCHVSGTGECCRGETTRTIHIPHHHPISADRFRDQARPRIVHGQSHRVSVLGSRTDRAVPNELNECARRADGELDRGFRGRLGIRPVT
ncbi:hypothetical protein GCM10022238_14560 [Gordonia hankookensis]